MLKILLITQKEKEPLAEKFVARKIEFHLSISYIQKSEDAGKVFKKIKISNHQPEWVDINLLEETVQRRLEEKAKVGLKSDHRNRDDTSGDRDKVGYTNAGNRHQSTDNDPYNKTSGNHPDPPGNETYNATKVRPTARRSLPNTPDDETLVILDKQDEQGEYVEFGNEMKPIHRLLTVREQRILADADRERFNIGGQMRSNNTHQPIYQAEGYQNLSGGVDQNQQQPRFNIGGQVRNYYNFGGQQSHPGPMDHNKPFPKVNVRGQERSSYNFRATKAL